MPRLRLVLMQAHLILSFVWDEGMGMSLHPLDDHALCDGCRSLSYKHIPLLESQYRKE
jgi:hypothetical protein